MKWTLGLEELNNEFGIKSDFVCQQPNNLLKKSSLNWCWMLIWGRAKFYNIIKWVEIHNHNLINMLTL